MLLISLKELEHREHHAHAHNLLRECLKVYGIAYSEDTPMNKNDMGKPSLAEYPHIHFNLSHAKGIAACIVSEKECGIDCEQVRKCSQGVMRRSFTESERELVERLPEDQRDLMFTRLWTLKESYVKAKGEGLSSAFDSLELSLINTIRINTDRKARFWTWEGAEYQTALCTLDGSDPYPDRVEFVELGR